MFFPNAAKRPNSQKIYNFTFFSMAATGMRSWGPELRLHENSFGFNALDLSPAGNGRVGFELIWVQLKSGRVGFDLIWVLPGSGRVYLDLI